MFMWLVILASGFLVLTFFAAMPGESSKEARAPFWGANHAHHGLCTKDKALPKNSLAAFTAAVDAGYGIALDICLTADGQVVVFGDKSLEHMCGLQKKVCEISFEEIRTHTLCATQQKVPHLWEVLDLVNQQVPLIINILPTQNPGQLCTAAWHILRTYDGDFCVQSTCAKTLHWWKKHVPGILRGQMLLPQKGFKNGFLPFLQWHCLANFVGRPQFLACPKAGLAPLAKFALRFCMGVVYTIGPQDNVGEYSQKYDAILFEYCRPEPN